MSLYGLGLFLFCFGAYRTSDPDELLLDVPVRTITSFPFASQSHSAVWNFPNVSHRHVLEAGRGRMIIFAVFGKFREL